MNWRLQNVERTVVVEPFQTKDSSWYLDSSKIITRDQFVLRFSGKLQLRSFTKG